MLGGTRSIARAQRPDDLVARHRAVYANIERSRAGYRHAAASMDSLGLEQQSSEGGKLDQASANLWVGAVLAHNGENEAAAAKLRKAFELYSDLAGAHVNSVEDSPAGYRKALADLAAQASPDLRQAIETQLRESATS